MKDTRKTRQNLIQIYKERTNNTSFIFLRHTLRYLVSIYLVSIPWKNPELISEELFTSVRRPEVLHYKIKSWGLLCFKRDALKEAAAFLPFIKRKISFYTYTSAVSHSLQDIHIKEDNTELAVQ